VPAKAAEQAAEHLVTADLRGTSSDGVMRLPVHTKRLRQGLADPTAPRVVVLDMPGAALIDAQNGIGILVADAAMELAKVKAGTHGTGLVGVRHSNHFVWVSLHQRAA